MASYQYKKSKSCKRAQPTNWTGAQAGSLFHEAIEIRHLLIQGAKCRAFVLYSFSLQFIVMFWMFAEVIDTKLCNLDQSISLKYQIVELCSLLPLGPGKH